MTLAVFGNFILLEKGYGPNGSGPNGSIVRKGGINGPQTLSFILMVKPLSSMRLYSSSLLMTSFEWAMRVRESQHV